MPYELISNLEGWDNYNSAYQIATYAILKLLPVGVILPFGSSTAPDLWLVCDGSAVSRTTYTTLFDVIGTSYGSGDGSTTFNLPDLAGRLPMGAGSPVSHGSEAGALTAAHTHGVGTLAVASHSHGAGSLVADSHAHGAGSYEASHSHTLEGTALLGAGLLGGTISTEDAPVTGTSGSASPSVSGTTASASPSISGASASDATSILPPVTGVTYVIYAGLE